MYHITFIAIGYVHQQQYMHHQRYANGDEQQYDLHRDGQLFDVARGW